MKAKLIEVGDQGELFLSIPKRIMGELGWKGGDDITVELPMVGGTILLYKDRKNDYPRAS